MCSSDLAVLEQFAANPEGGGRKAALLSNVKEDASRPEFLPQNAVLFLEVLDHFLLLPIHPAGKGYE